VTDHLDDDENMKDMRQTARKIGLTDLLVKIYATDNTDIIKSLAQRALRLLGERS
jgi:hypothetical protein